MNPGPEYGGIVGGVFSLKNGYGVCILPLPMRIKWLSILSCINASCSSIPNIYIFKGMSFRQNFIIKCKEEFVWLCKKNVDDENIVQRMD